MIYHNIALFILLWLVCGLWAYGRTLAYFQGRYQLIAPDMLMQDRLFAMQMGCFGITGLIVTYFLNKPNIYGVRWI
jgi:hypothetical protein